ncbi:hypothetical protein [Pedobacter sp. GR22-6]|uniref:hypothetical protein n=1 Tax=Pedobacter sp. GR22-6 TaxID=3127957 RepID=UPI00307F2C29
MKNLELNQLGVQEMNSTEMNTLEGGGLLSGLLGGRLNGVLTPVTDTVTTVKNDTFAYLSKQVDSVIKLVWNL